MVTEFKLLDSSPEIRALVGSTSNKDLGILGSVLGRLMLETRMGELAKLLFII